jgi:lysozyme family protein
MKESFDKAIEFVLKREGLYSNDSSDLGGETNFGISKKAYPNLDIKNLTIDDAKEIYRRDYWNDLNCDLLPEKLDIVVFDCGVNQGTGKATELLYKCDKDWKNLLFLRIQHYNNIVGKNPKQIKFLRGWTNRILELWTAIK